MEDFHLDFRFASYLGGTHSTFIHSAFGFPAVVAIFLTLLLFANNAGMNCSTHIWTMSMKKIFKHFYFHQAGYFLTAGDNLQKVEI